MINVVAAILKNDDKILIARKKEGKPLAGLWEFPGGKIEIGESPEEALIRELREEMEISIKVNKYVGESIYDYGNNKLISLKGFEAEIIDGKIKLSDHDAFEWITRYELKNYAIAPADIFFLDKI